MKQFKVVLKNGEYVLITGSMYQTMDGLLRFEDGNCLISAMFPVENVLYAMEVDSKEAQ
jgi:hypothetical protein